MGFNSAFKGLKEELMVESSGSNNAWSSPPASAHWVMYVELYYELLHDT